MAEVIEERVKRYILDGAAALGGPFDLAYTPTSG
jgi:hypothetical protein